MEDTDDCPAKRPFTAKHATPALAGGARESTKIFKEQERKNLSFSSRPSRIP